MSAHRTTGPIPCPSCHQGTPNGLLCRECTDLLRRYLSPRPDRRDAHYLPDLMRDLQTSYSRQSRVGRGSGGRRVKGDEAGSRPVPWDNAAAKAADTVVKTVGSIIADLAAGAELTEDGCRCRPYAACNGTAALRPRMGSWCRWLEQRIPQIRGHGHAGQIMADLRRSVQLIRRVIDLPAERMYIGRCWLCHTDVYVRSEEQDHDDVECPSCRDVVSRAEAQGAPPGGFVPRFDPAGSRADLRAAVATSEATRSDILEVITLMLAVQIRPGTFDSWVLRGKLIPSGDRDGIALYRVAVVLELAKAAPERKAVERGKISA